MLRSRYFELVCAIFLVCAIALAAAIPLLGSAGVIAPARDDAYLERLFAPGEVHAVDIQADDWDGFIATASSESYLRCDVTIDGETLHGVGIRAKGNNSLGHVARRGLERYSLKIEFDHFEQSLSYHGLDKLSLDAAFQDNSYLKSYLAFDMMRFMGVPAPATSFASVTVNGEPWGLFLAIEEPEDAFAERMWGSAHGALYKPDYRSLEDENADIALRYIDEDPDSYPGIFDHARTGATPDGENRLVRALRNLSAGEVERAVDVNAVLRYFAAHAFTANLDSYLGSTGHNYLLYEEDGRISMLPWDYNLAFGTYALGRAELVDEPGPYVNLPIDTPAADEVLADRPLFTRLMDDPVYRERYHDNLDRLVSEYVESGRLESVIRTAADMIAPYVAEDATAFCTYEEFLVGVDTLETFCLLRAESIRGQLEGTIPSTNAGQAAAPDTLVDASSIRLQDLGELSDLDDGGGRRADQ